MTCTIFKTDPELVTPFGIWLSNHLNRGADIVWPFVRQHTYDILKKQFFNQTYALHESYRHLEEFEEYHFGSTESIMPFPSGVMKYSYEEYSLLVAPVERFRIKLEPLRGEFEIDTRHLMGSPTKYVQERIIKQIGETWRQRGEAEIRRFFESLEDNDQIRKVSKY
jgi:hypothetical protein